MTSQGRVTRLGLRSRGNAMVTDRYDNTITAASAAVADAYADAVDCLLAGAPGLIPAFEAVTQADPEFALGWVGLARAHQSFGAMPEARQAMERARSVPAGLTERERSHLNAFDLLIAGKGPQAYAAIRAHVNTWPRDALVAQTCSSVFGLIGFSGQPGREAEILAYTAALMPHYGEDWWMTSQYAFALCENGALARAEDQIDRALALKDRNAHGAHVRSHILYETGRTAEGRAWLSDWLAPYARDGIMYGHLTWHSALWSLAEGDTEAMWAQVDAAVAPDSGTLSPGINVLTDTASILQRAMMAGVGVSADRWAAVSDYALRTFPATGNAFIDVHAALAHAMAGNDAALEAIISAPAGPAADLVPGLACGFRAMAAEDWGAASENLTGAMNDLARIGGSRAQRDLLEQCLLTCLIRDGRDREAHDIARLRRPLLVSGADAHAAH